MKSWTQRLSLLGILLVVPAFDALAQKIISFDEQNKIGAFLSLTADQPTLLEIEFTLAGFQVQAVTLGQNRFSEIRLGERNQAQTGFIGQAKLPAMRRWLEVPTDAKLEISFGDIRQRTIFLEGFDLPSMVVPVQPPQPKIYRSPENRRFVLDQDYYRKNYFTSFEDDPPVRISWSGIVRGRRLVLLEIDPFRYIPATGELQIITRATVRIEFSSDANPDYAIDSERYRAPSFDVFLDRLIFNRKHSVPPPTEGPTGYLIIAADELAASTDLQEFSTWKHRSGHQVVINSVSQAGQTPQAIKEWITAAYRDWEYPPLHVLLVGETDTLNAFTGLSWNAPATDLYYAAIDGADYLPDIWLGRLPAANAEQLAIIIDKTLSYEQGLWSVPDAWENRALFIASEDRHEISEATHEHVINTYLDQAGFQSQRLYAHSYQATGDDISQGLEQGASLAIYSGHGDTVFWIDPYFDIGDISALENSVFPVVHSYACLTGRYNYRECFGESWLTRPGGAVIFWGSSVNSYWEEDDILERAVFEGFFNPQPAGQTALTWASGMADYGKLGLLAYYGNTENMQLYFEMYNLMGDPSLDVWTASPEPLSPVYDLEIVPQTQSIQVVVPGKTGARVGLTDGERLLGCGFTDQDGRAQVELIDSIAEGDVLQLTITGHNLAPYIAEIAVKLTTFNLDEFSAEGAPVSVELSWRTSGENGVRGYNLVRSTDSEGPYNRIAEVEIAAGTGDYSYTDRNLAERTTYWYRLEVISTGGSGSLYGLVEATTEKSPDQDGDDDKGCCGQ